MLYRASLIAVNESIDPTFMKPLRLLCFSFYLLDFIIGVSAYLGDYLKNGYRLFDVFVLIIYAGNFYCELWYPYFGIYTSLRVLRGFQIVRIFRVIQTIKSLERVVDALMYTMRTSVLDVICLAIMVVFMLGVVGHTLFGLDQSVGLAYYDWETLPASFLTIWVFICGDFWLPYYDRLVNAGFIGCEYWCLILIILGNFVISNLFVGVISQVLF
jgi:cation channel sperm-associated protein 3